MPIDSVYAHCGLKVEEGFKGEIYKPQGGITHRNWLAAKAMQELINKKDKFPVAFPLTFPIQFGGDLEKQLDDIAKLSYAMADAMLKVLK